ncbi:unnamed protein product, partial [Prorocentrum cordatum]
KGAPAEIAPQKLASEAVAEARGSEAAQGAGAREAASAQAGAREGASVNELQASGLEKTGHEGFEARLKRLSEPVPRAAFQPALPAKLNSVDCGAHVDYVKMIQSGAQIRAECKWG